MSNRGASTRFYVSVLIVVLFLTYANIKCLTYAKSDIVIQTQSPLVVDSDYSSTTEKFEITSSQNQVTTDQATSNDDIGLNSVAVSASGTVQGEIIEKFISPYTANTSYNNVYLKNNTDLTIDLKDFVNGNINFKIEKNDQPQVLILHTHATESFLRHNESYYTENDTSRTTNNEYNMVALGKIISDRLNTAGIVTLHDTTQHDYPSYNESYGRAAKTISTYLKKYPSIKIVIDLHRDAIAANNTDKVKVTTEINGKKAAQIMLVMGSQSGNVTNFPNWKENLKLATKLQQTIEVLYPSLARSIHFMPKNYNQSLTTGSLLIEIGTDGNTIDEAKYSAELLSDSLIALLNTL